jgi:hypothetical protein
MARCSKFMCVNPGVMDLNICCICLSLTTMYM